MTTEVEKCVPRVSRTSSRACRPSRSAALLPSFWPECKSSELGRRRGQTALTAGQDSEVLRMYAASQQRAQFRRTGLVVFAIAAWTGLLAVPGNAQTCTSNAIVCENLQPGTAGWQVTG